MYLHCILYYALNRRDTLFFLPLGGVCACAFGQSKTLDFGGVYNEELEK